YEKSRLADVEWTDAAIKQYLLRMSSIGIFWSDLFDCPPIPANVRVRLVKLLEQLAIEWSASDQHSKNTKQRVQER
ncbi:MAG: hypothetical protein WBN34_07470, partial [Woeseia sp.]